MRLEETSIAINCDKRAVMATIFGIISNMLFLILMFATIYCVFVNPLLLILLLPVLGIAVLLRFLSIRANVSYDYTIADGSFAINKIINNKKRKQIFDFSAQDIFRVTIVTNHISKRKDKKMVICSANDYPPDGKSFILLETKEKLVFIEASDKLIVCLNNKTF